MAIKNKETEKKSRILEILTTETKWESYLFVLVSIAALVLGILFLNGILAIRSDFPVLGSIPTAFAIILVVIGTIGLIYGLYPFFKPAWPELKKVTWPTWMHFLGDTVRTFIFIITLALLFILFDVLITEILQYIYK